jgi:hypothetical protein
MLANACVMPACAASGNVTAETAFGLISAPTTRAFMAWPANYPPSANTLDGREFWLRLGILVTTGGSITYGPSIRLYSGANTGLTTFTSDTAIITPSAPTISTATRLITIFARCQWDITSAHLNGSYTLEVDSAYTATAALTAGLTSGVATQSAIQFCVTGIFGTTNASNNAILKYFEMDLI